MLERLESIFGRRNGHPLKAAMPAIVLPDGYLGENRVVIEENKPIEVVEVISDEASESFPYHQTKEIIEQAWIKYGEGLKDQVLKPISFSRERDVSSIEFKITSGVNLFALLSAAIQPIGDAEVRTYSWDNSILLDKNGLNIRLRYDQVLGSKVTFTTKNDLKTQDIEAVINTYKIANPINEDGQKPKEVLKSLGVTIFNPEDAPSWDYLAGYEGVKQQIRETVILPFQHPEIYEQIARQTRKQYEPNRSKAILFEGPPGTGKTTMAKVIAGVTEASLVYVPIESIMSKWYGESEGILADIFDKCRLIGPSLLFLDEIDSLATSRGDNMHEATRRILSVLLRKIDGFNPNAKTILIGATNRKNDLDIALLSRFDTNIEFPLPNLCERQAIFGNYAQHLKEPDLAILAEKANSLSGRDIKIICEKTERSLASALIARNSDIIETPTLGDYLNWVKER